MPSQVSAKSLWHHTTPTLDHRKDGRESEREKDLATRPRKLPSVASPLPAAPGELWEICQAKWDSPFQRLNLLAKSLSPQPITEHLKHTNISAVPERGERGGDEPLLEKWMSICSTQPLGCINHKEFKFSFEGLTSMWCVFDDSVWSFEGEKPFRVAEGQLLR